MSRQIEVSQPLSRREKLKVTVAGATLGALALSAGAVGLNKLTEPSPLEGTHQENISVTFGEQATTETGMAAYLQKSLNSPDSTAVLVERMDAVDPGHDATVDQGQHMTVPVDVPNNQK